MNALTFNFNDGQLKFDNNNVDNANENYGTASGFLGCFSQVIAPLRRGYLIERIQPPSMRPISVSCSVSFR